MSYLASALHIYGYVLLFPLAAVEGPVVALVAGFFVYLGYFHFLPAYGIMLLGDVIPDSIYYYIGRFGARRKMIEKYSARLPILGNNFPVVEKLWNNHGRKTMFFGKLAYGLSIPFLVSAGLVRMSYGRFLAYAVPVTVFQYGAIMTAGYALGHSYASAAGYITYAGVAVAVGVLVTFSFLLSRYARKEIMEMEGEDHT